MEQKKMKENLTYGIVGGGKAGTFIFNLLKDSTHSKILFLIEKDQSNTLATEARKRNIPIFSSITEIGNLTPHYIFEATGIPEVRKELYTYYPQDESPVRIIDNEVAYFFYQVLDEHFFGDTDDDDDDIFHKYLTFNLSQEIYAFPLWQVTEIITMLQITPLPEAPPYIKGIIKLRDEVIPCLSLRKFFHQEEKEIDNQTCIIILEFQKRKIGVIVDQVYEVTAISQNKIEKNMSETNFGTMKKNVISGIGRLQDNNVAIILNVENLLSGEVFFEEEEKLSQSISS